MAKPWMALKHSATLSRSCNVTLRFSGSFGNQLCLPYSERRLLLRSAQCNQHQSHHVCMRASVSPMPPQHLAATAPHCIDFRGGLSHAHPRRSATPMGLDVFSLKPIHYSQKCASDHMITIILIGEVLVLFKALSFARTLNTHNRCNC